MQVRLVAGTFPERTVSVIRQVVRRASNSLGRCFPEALSLVNLGPSSSLSSWWHHNSDLSLTRRARIDEQRQLEFRVEFFNVWNTPQFDNPNNDINSGQFGETTRVLDPERPARVIQMGIKFLF